MKKSQLISLNTELELQREKKVIDNSVRQKMSDLAQIQVCALIIGLSCVSVVYFIHLFTK